MGHDVASRLYSAYEIIFSVATAVTTLMILPQVTMFSEHWLENFTVESDVKN